MLEQSIDIPEWTQRALCAQIDPELWFPEGKGQSPKSAREFCRSCPVLEECREYAIERNIKHGIWGDTTPRERAAIRRARGLIDDEPDVEPDDF